MTEEEKKAIEYLENSLNSTITHKKQLNIVKNLIQKQQEEINKKDKIIDETCKFLEDLQLSKDIEGYEIMKKSDWKQYFKKKVEEKNDNS